MSDAIALVRISSVRLDLYYHWLKPVVVIVHAWWASAGIFPVCMWLAEHRCWRHDLASWSEREAGLKRGVGPEERERAREKPCWDPRAATSRAGWERPTGYSVWTVFLSLFTDLNINTRMTGWTWWLVSRRNLSRYQKEINWELRCGWGVSYRLLDRKKWLNALLFLPRFLCFATGDKNLWSDFNVLHNKCIAIMVFAHSVLNLSLVPVWIGLLRMRSDSLFLQLDSSFLASLGCEMERTWQLYRSPTLRMPLARTGRGGTSPDNA